MKKKYPYIRVILVFAYLDKLFDDVDKKFNKQTYDEIIYPPLESVPKRYAIVARNKWMADRSDHIIFYVNCSFGGAVKKLEYAIIKGKSYTNIGIKNTLVKIKTRVFYLLGEKTSKSCLWIICHIINLYSLSKGYFIGRYCGKFF